MAEDEHRQLVVNGHRGPHRPIGDEFDRPIGPEGGAVLLAIGL